MIVARAMVMEHVDHRAPSVSSSTSEVEAAMLSSFSKAPKTSLMEVSRYLHDRLVELRVTSYTPSRPLYERCPPHQGSQHD